MDMQIKIQKYLVDSKLNKTEQEILNVLKKANRYKGKKRAFFSGKQYYKAAYKLSDKGYVEVIDDTATRKSDYRELFGGIGGKQYTEFAVEVILKEK